MKLGERIYQLRKERNLSQGDLADALHVSRQSVSKWETDSSTPDLDKLVKLSEMFGVSLDELVTGTTAPTVEKKQQQLPEQRPTGRAVAAVVLLVLGGIGSVLFFATTLLYFTVWMLLAGLLCWKAKNHLGIYLGLSGWIFTVLFFSTCSILSPWLALRPIAYQAYEPFVLILAWLMFGVLLVILGAAIRAAWKQVDRRFLLRLGVAAALLFLVQTGTAIWIQQSILGAEPGFYYPWPVQMSWVVLLMGLFPLPGGYRRQPYVMLTGYLFSLCLDSLVAGAFSDHTFLQYYWPLLLLLFYLLLAWVGARWEKRGCPSPV